VGGVSPSCFPTPETVVSEGHHPFLPQTCETPPVRAPHPLSEPPCRLSSHVAPVPPRNTSTTSHTSVTLAAHARPGFACVSLAAIPCVLMRRSATYPRVSRLRLLHPRQSERCGLRRCCSSNQPNHRATRQDLVPPSHTGVTRKASQTHGFTRCHRVSPRIPQDHPSYPAKPVNPEALCVSSGSGSPRRLTRAYL
jgi:hypothetical protein